MYILENKVRIDSIIQKNDYDELVRIFSKENLSIDELLIFYAKNKEVLKRPSFWKSLLPHFHLSNLLNSSFKSVFLNSYFSSRNSCSHELNRHLIAIAKPDFIKYLKFHQKTSNQDFLNSLVNLCSEFPDLNQLINEFKIILNAQKIIENDEEHDRPFFNKFSIGETLVGFLIYQDVLKSQINPLNRELYVSHEMELVNELDKFLKLMGEESLSDIYFTSNVYLQKELSKYSSPDAYSANKEPNKYILLHTLIHKQILRTRKRNCISLYLNSYFDFKSTLLNPAPLTSNEHYRRFQINNNKSTPENIYIADIRIDPASAFNEKLPDIKPSVKVLNYYGIPSAIESGKGKVELKSVLQLLTYFSVYKSPKTFGSIVYKEDPLFSKYFGVNEPITLYNYAELVKNISSYFKWEHEKAEVTLDFVCYNLEGIKLNSWLSKPFLKIGNKVIWPGAFLRDRRWDNIILNRLKKESEHEKLVKVISNNLELKVYELFSKYFSTLKGEVIQISGAKSEVDVMAYLDNCLFICEVKSGTRSDEFGLAADVEYDKLEGAAKQLKRAEELLRKDWKNIKLKLNIPENTTIDSIKIIPLIVTDFFEGDQLLYDSVRKVSLIELDVIISNGKKRLLETYIIMNQYSNMHNPNLSASSFIKSWDLWEGSKTFSVEMFLKNIENNSVWKEMENIWRFEDSTFTIEY